MIGSKKEAASYREISKAYGLDPVDILFLSDVPAELDAARSAGMKTGLCVRPGNAEVSDANEHDKFTDFAQVELI